MDPIMGKVALIVLIKDSYDAEAKKELDELIELAKRLRQWKIGKVSTLPYEK